MYPKLFLITGVSSGIGFQVTKDLLDSGHSVLGVSRQKTVKVKTLQSAHPKNFYFEKRDLSKDIDKHPKWVLEKSKSIGTFSGFVHSAGIIDILPLKALSYKSMLDLFNINVFAGIALARGISDKRAFSSNGGSIVFVSSIASQSGEAGLTNYSASKAAINGAMRAIAMELSSQKIRVNSVLPGFTMTEMIEKHKDVYNDSYIKELNNKYPLGIGSVLDVSNTICFLLSDKSNWITGSEFQLNGGAKLGG
jgi:3-oxoacyl-[acyl-carrier protein] reductase